MGMWERFKSAFVSEKTVEQVDRAAQPTPIQPARPAPQWQPEVHKESTSYKQSAATAKFYEAERERAKAAGQTVKGYRAGYISAADAKAQLVAGPDGLPPLKLVTSDNGLDLALPDGKLIDYNTLALRHFQIFAFRVVGMGYYEDPERPFKFRNGQRVAVKREADNEHDANAVAITTSRAATKIGYVNKQRAKWVADLLDKGGELDGIVIQTKSSSPRVLLTTPEMLAHLRRS
ncbi:HIRAN domain-containing protein [Arthrobacter sp. ISL-69]|uniref:HIRAN domain-containing protein n=1 Tax=Arthrobacter sp. ISL-69 TaxID=2819113 RepID=UPI001BE5F2E8|nr:HIRAN domain-containing protein [Arthrobacter sp. ISL-69]MBT2535882.1 HIRAN domain-containing protein [Arthrobacter sp. ISL-69]